MHSIWVHVFVSSSVCVCKCMCVVLSFDSSLQGHLRLNLPVSGFEDCLLGVFVFVFMFVSEKGVSSWSLSKHRGDGLRQLLSGWVAFGSSKQLCMLMWEQTAAPMGVIRPGEVMTAQQHRKTPRCSLRIEKQGWFLLCFKWIRVYHECITSEV